MPVFSRRLGASDVFRLIGQDERRYRNRYPSRRLTIGGHLLTIVDTAGLEVPEHAGRLSCCPV